MERMRILQGTGKPLAQVGHTCTPVRKSEMYDVHMTSSWRVICHHHFGEGLHNFLQYLPSNTVLYHPDIGHLTVFRQCTRVCAVWMKMSLPHSRRCLDTGFQLVADSGAFVGTALLEEAYSDARLCDSASLPFCFLSFVPVFEVANTGPHGLATMAACCCAYLA